MGEGLRPHHHIYYEVETRYYHDHEKGCAVRNTTFRCMICGKEYHERYEYHPPPDGVKHVKSLDKQKRKYNSRK